jgi:hypothetical protein
MGKSVTDSQNIILPVGGDKRADTGNVLQGE